MINLKEKIQKFNQRWNLPDKQIDPHEDFLKFKTRVLNDIKGIDHCVTQESISKFCRFLGIQEKWERVSPYSNDRYINNIIGALIEEENEIKFYKLLKIIFLLDIHPQKAQLARYGSSGTIFSKKNLYIRIKESISYSNVNLAIEMLDNGEVIFFPKGEEKLDDELVNKVLKFLDTKSNTHFIDALKFYQNKDYVKSAEQLRRVLEEFLRFKLKNDCDLAVNKSEIGKVLKEKNSEAQIRNIIAQIFGYLDQYFNKNSKHNDGELEEYDNEFLIYQVGLLLRYINHIIH